MGTVHPNNEELLAFIEQPQQYPYIADHLSDCMQCRTQSARLSQLPQRLQSLPIELDGDEGKRHQRERLHQALSRTQMDSALGTTGMLGEKTRTTPSRGWLQWLLLPMPVGMAAAVTVAAVAMVLLATLPARTSLVQFQDEAGIKYVQAQTAPGMGFFNSEKITRADYAGAQVTLQGQGIRIRWAPVADAMDYTLELYQIEQGEPQLLQHLTTQALTAELTPLALQPGHRYSWRLRGALHNGGRFEVNGGFVVATE